MDPDESCAHCELVGDPNISIEDRHRLFHEECDSCRPDDLAKEEASLCPSCKHLRPRHLLFCPDDTPRCEIEVGSLQDVESRLASGCVLCELICVACRTAVEQPRLKDHPPSSWTFGLDFMKAHAEDGDFASIYLFIYDGDGDAIQATMICQAYLRQDQDAGSSAWPLRDNNADLVQPLIEWGRVKGWLRRCCTEHDTCCDTPDSLVTPPPGFRVIDVDTRRLVRPRQECRFVALSYVWGANSDPSKLQTTMSNVDRLEEEGALESSKIPAAIDEAMQVCQRLGERYLWADRLCVVQDDPVNKMQLIMAMVDIYSSAVLVVALCAGASMDDSIPGVRTARPASKRTVELQGLLVTTVLPSFGEVVMPSVWASRGWTYQEAALSTRTLYFTPFQLLYECHAGHVYEDNFLNESPWCETDIPCGGGYQNRMPAIKGAYTDETRFISYGSHVGNYNSRSLTYGSDVYNAFAGALSQLYGQPAATVHGLPLSNFDEALLWYPDVEPHQDPPAYRVSDGVDLPCWSWSSVTGRVTYSFLAPSFKGPIVRWARVCGTGAERTSEPIRESGLSWREEWTPGPDLAASSMRLREAPPQLYMALAAAEGCLEAVDDLGADFYRMASSFVDAAALVTKRWPQYRDFCHEAFEKGGEGSRSDVPEATALDVPAITTRAQLTSLSLGQHAHQRRFGPCPREGAWLEIRGPAGACVGMLAPSPSLSGWAPPAGDAEFEFIGISISALPDGYIGDGLGCLYPSAEYGLDSVPYSAVREKLRELRHLDFTYWDGGGRPLFPIPIVVVMLIERKGGRARRVSIGWVLLAKWARLERRYESIALV